jgi:ribulose-5-phosphate 4-epimerase/fuculose-1-phosphate aldolase
MQLKELRERVVEVGLTLYDFRLVGISDGNVSARDPETNLVAVKPAGFNWKTLRAEDVPLVDVDGNLVEGDNRPSSETPMHTCIYRQRPEIMGAIHCHAPFSVAWSVVNKPIPAIIVNQVMTGGEIPISPFNMPGTLELGECALDDMGENGLAVVLQGHGTLCIGRSVEHALHITLAVEDAAKTAIYAKIIGGEMRSMEDDIAEMIRQYKKG